MNTPMPVSVQVDIPDFTLLYHGATLSEPDQKALVEIFERPVFRKWLNVLVANSIKEHWEIPLTTLSQDGLLTSHLKTAFVKGQISILQTMLTYYDEKPPAPTP